LVVSKTMHQSARQVAVIAGDHYSIEVVVTQEQSAIGFKNALRLLDQRSPVLHALDHILANYGIKDIIWERQVQNVSLYQFQTSRFDLLSMSKASVAELPVNTHDLAATSYSSEQGQEGLSTATPKIQHNIAGRCFDECCEIMVKPIRVLLLTVVHPTCPITVGLILSGRQKASVDSVTAGTIAKP
jgi:hypothetical protein